MEKGTSTEPSTDIKSQKEIPDTSMTDDCCICLSSLAYYSIASSSKMKFQYCIFHTLKTSRIKLSRLSCFSTCKNKTETETKTEIPPWIKVLPCKGKHAFHTKCIDKWFENNDTCPICREKFIFIDVF